MLSIEFEAIFERLVIMPLVKIVNKAGIARYLGVYTTYTPSGP